MAADQLVEELVLTNRCRASVDTLPGQEAALMHLPDGNTPLFATTHNLHTTESDTACCLIAQYTAGAGDRGDALCMVYKCAALLNLI